MNKTSLLLFLISDHSPLLLAGSCSDESTYDLFAVCNHYGRMGFGHYTALARQWIGEGLSPDWYSFDDDVVSRCTSITEVKSNAAYVLFYRKRASSTHRQLLVEN
jgi:ubiquitin C-terminal hydrolase